jgi:short-subunit dehydrogenase
MDGQGKTALVTGASSGIGLAISEELAKRGFSLVMVSNEEKALSDAAHDLEEKYKVKTASFCMDLAQSDSAQKLFNYCRENNFKIEVLVNNAGIFFFKDITDTPPEKIEKTLNLHIVTPSLLTRIFAEQMVADNRKGYILNMSSIASRMMMPGIALYSSTKSFLRCFSRSMRNEVYDSGVSITTLSPGAVATGLYNLPQRYLKLGVSLGIIMSPSRLAKTAVKKMFARKAEYMPSGLLNGFFIFLVWSIPQPLVRWIKRKVNKKIKK